MSVTFTVADSEGNKGSVALPYLVAAIAAVFQIGLSPGGGALSDLQTQLTAMPRAEAVRVFLGASLPVKVSGNAIFAATIAAGREAWISWNTMPTKAQFQAVVADWIASGGTIWWDYRHEVDAPKEAAPQFVSEYDQLQAWAEAVPGYAASKVRDQCIFMAYLLDPKQPHGVPSTWYPTRPTRTGFDCYNLANLARAVAEAKAHGWRWVIPEYGAGGPNSEAGTGDDNALAWAKKATAAWATYPPEGACWYSSTQGNGISTTLSILPKTAAYLATLA